jgi:hypothetical protein
MDCHSTRDWSLFSGPMKPGTLGGGGEKFGREMDMPGNIYVKNITPYALGNWTDGEIFRAITGGVSKDGTALFPLMPYHAFGKMDKEDVYCIIAYLRTIPAIKNDVPPTELDFPLNFILNTMPVKPAFTKLPDTSNAVQYGQYLVTAASCVDCHSKAEKGELVPGTEFGGGRSFMFPGGAVTSANITPDMLTGIGNWTKEAFIKRFTVYADSAYHAPAVAPTDFNSPMPWTMYATMTEKDLGAIYEFLHSLKPINNPVTKFKKSKL